MDFYDFYYFLNPLSGSVLVQKSEKWSMEKQAKKKSNIFMQAMRSIPALAPCGPLKEFKKSAIPPGLASKGSVKRK